MMNSEHFHVDQIGDALGNEIGQNTMITVTKNSWEKASKQDM
jgi:hypothetical protein